MSIVALPALVVWPSLARAADDDASREPPALGAAANDDLAREAMRRGIAAFARGDAAAALAEYETAERLAPNANVPYRFAAQASAALERWHDVVTNLEQYLAKKPTVSDAAATRARIAAVKAEHFPAHLTVTCDAAGAVVAIDGEARGAPGTFELSPGRHQVEVTAPRKTRSVQHIAAVGEHDHVAQFTLADEPAPAPVAIVPTPTQTPDARGAPAGTTLRTAGVVTLAIGAATLATTLAIDAAVLGPQLSKYEAAADRGDASARDLRDDAAATRGGVLVGYIAGGVLSAAGAAFVLLAPRSRRVVAITPTAAPGYASVSARVAF